MRYTEYGLHLTVSELERLLEDVKHGIKYENKESCIYIKGGKEPKISTSWTQGRVPPMAVLIIFTGMISRKAFSFFFSRFQYTDS